MDLEWRNRIDFYRLESLFFFFYLWFKVFDILLLHSDMELKDEEKLYFLLVNEYLLHTFFFYFLQEI